MLLINCKIYTMENEIIENGYIYIQDKFLKDIGKMENLKISCDETLDLKGSCVYPGFIDGHCHLGLWEDGLGFEGDDGNEDTDPATSNLRAIDGINPMDRCFEEALEGGVTTVVTGPGSANPIAGSWTAIKTYGKRIDNMMVKQNVGMKFALGENPKTVYNAKNQSPITRLAICSIIRENLQKTKNYIEDIEKAELDEDLEKPEYDPKLEALIPVLKREIKSFFHCHRADDIFTAIRISKEFNLDYVLIHCTEGHLIADELAELNSNVVTGPILSDRSKPELKNLTPSNPAELSDKNINFCICTDHPVIPIQYLALNAGIAVKEGLSYDEALKAITIKPAIINGIDDKVGSIKIGKHADLVVFDNDPLSVYSKPKYVFVNGRQVI